MSLSSVRWSDVDKKDSFIRSSRWSTSNWLCSERMTVLQDPLTCCFLLLIENLNERNLTRCGNLETSPSTNEISPHRPGARERFWSFKFAPLSSSSYNPSSAFQRCSQSPNLARKWITSRKLKLSTFSRVFNTWKDWQSIHTTDSNSIVSLWMIFYYSGFKWGMG